MSQSLSLLMVTIDCVNNGQRRRVGGVKMVLMVMIGAPERRVGRQMVTVISTICFVVQMVFNLATGSN